MKHLMSLYLSGAILPLAQSVLAHSSQPTVTIGHTTIHGLEATLPGAPMPIHKFLGVPYGRIPRRFRPSEPMDYHRSPRVINATDYGPICFMNFAIPELGPSPQLLQDLFYNPLPEESEECLTLHVFTLAGKPSEGNGTRFKHGSGGTQQTGKEDKPVVVFIPGGGFQIASSMLELSAFPAYHGIVAVTLNYRTNIFGFPPPGPGLDPSERNLGLLDQRLALAWIQSHIHHFGGDPSRVTVWGESAGSMSTDLHLYAYANSSSPPFRAAILSSGQISFGLLGVSSSTTPQYWDLLASALNCTNATTSLACVQDAPATAVKQAMVDEQLAFGPAIDNVTMFPGRAQARREGRVAKVPILTGTVADEGRALVNDRVNFTLFLEAYFPPALVSPEAVEGILSAYQRGNGPTDFEVAAAIYTDYFWRCALLANSSVALGLPTWRYYFNISIVNLFPAEAAEAYSWLGVFHGSDVILPFYDPATTTLTAQQYAVAASMQASIARFVHNPTAGPGWPAVGSEFAPLDAVVWGDAGDAEIPVATVVNSTELDEVCALFAPLYPFLEFIT